MIFPGTGVTRDWITQLSRELVDPNYGMFMHLGQDLRTIHPNPDGAVVHGAEHPKLMHAAGAVLGVCTGLVLRN